eukprot:NODE_478_length_6971_cov_0.483411.p3 type:complete len:361 gc:universal NODE_478_length_6971_cov_0.483411:2975-4057(+)
MKPLPPFLENLMEEFQNPNIIHQFIDYMPTLDHLDDHNILQSFFKNCEIDEIHDFISHIHKLYDLIPEIHNPLTDPTMIRFLDNLVYEFEEKLIILESLEDDSHLDYDKAYEFVSNLELDNYLKYLQNQNVDILSVSPSTIKQLQAYISQKLYSPYNYTSENAILDLTNRLKQLYDRIKEISKCRLDNPFNMSEMKLFVKKLITDSNHNSRIPDGVKVKLEALELQDLQNHINSLHTKLEKLIDTQATPKEPLFMTLQFLTDTMKSKFASWKEVDSQLQILRTQVEDSLYTQKKIKQIRTQLSGYKLKLQEMEIRLTILEQEPVEIESVNSSTQAMDTVSEIIPKCKQRNCRTRICVYSN